MAFPQLLSASGSTGANTGGATVPLSFVGGNHANPSLGEDAMEIIVRDTYTLRNMWIRCIGFSSSNSMTVTSRKNAAAGSQTVTVNATGTFEDTTHSDSLTTGDTINAQGGTFTVGHTNTGITLGVISAILEHATAATPVVGIQMQPSSSSTIWPSTTTQTAYVGLPPIQGNQFYRATESETQHTLRHSMTVTNLRIYITTNTLNQSTTYTMRKNGADGNVTITFAASGTGSQEDTTHSDSYSSGDKIGTKGTTTATSGTTPTLTMFTYETACEAAYMSLQELGAASGSYFVGFGMGASTESQIQTKSRLSAQKAAYLFINTAVAPSGGNNTISLRIGAADTALALTVTSGSTGTFEDTTTQITLATTDLLSAGATRAMNGAEIGFAMINPVSGGDGTDMPWPQVDVLGPAPIVVLAI